MSSERPEKLALFNMLGKTRGKLVEMTRDKLKKYATELGLPHSNYVKRNEYINSIIEKVKNSPNLYPDWMSRVDAGNKRLYKPTTLLERKDKGELKRLAIEYGSRSVQH